MICLERIRLWLRQRVSRGKRLPTATPPVGSAPIGLAEMCPLDELVCLPIGTAFKVCRLRENACVELAELPTRGRNEWSVAMPTLGEIPGRPGEYVSIPFRKRCSIGGWLAFVNADLTGICVMKLSAEENQLQSQMLLVVPPGCSVRSVAMDSSMLYIGGTAESGSVAPSLWCVRLDQEARWLPFMTLLARGLRVFRPQSRYQPARRLLRARHRVPLDITHGYMPEDNKSFDDLIVDRERHRLIAIDDIVFPKYLFEFGLPDETLAKGIPVQQRIVAIEGHGTSECIVKGTLSRRYVVLLSCFGGWADRDRRCLSFHDVETLEEVASVQLPAKVCQDIATDDGWLYIAGGKAGLGVIQLNECSSIIESSPHPLVFPATCPTAKTAEAKDLAARLQYVELPLAGHLQSVHPTEKPGVLCATLRDQGQYRTVLLRFSDGVLMTISSQV